MVQPNFDHGNSQTEKILTNILTKEHYITDSICELVGSVGGKDTSLRQSVCAIIHSSFHKTKMSNCRI